ncbi:hypothetical protein HOY82DRAFT_549483 [Tuber indicum]|nr:hypothetical protein HOY82DRAFT_549483 [Tuber indicum]
MSAVPAQKVGDSAAPAAPQPWEPIALDTDYYLTKGLEDAEHLEYRNRDSFTGAIDSRAGELSSGGADESQCPYLILSPVTQTQLAIIENIRDTSYKRLRFLYLNDPQALIVKVMPSGLHEFATEAFMGLRRALPSVGRTTYEGTLSKKEADGGFKPPLARPRENDWPTIVLESGVSESPQRLKVGARWWLANSRGDVKIVLLFFVSKAARTIRTEQWELESSENSRIARAYPGPAATRPTIKGLAKIDAHSVTGGALELGFEKVFLRAPDLDRGEGDFTFTIQDLRDYYDDVWTAAL